MFGRSFFGGQRSWLIDVRDVNVISSERTQFVTLCRLRAIEKSRLIGVEGFLRSRQRIPNMKASHRYFKMTGREL